VHPQNDFQDARGMFIYLASFLHSKYLFQNYFLFGLLVGGGVREELPEKRSANIKKSQKGT